LQERAWREKHKTGTDVRQVPTFRYVFCDQSASPVPILHEICSSRQRLANHLIRTSMQRQLTTFRESKFAPRTNG